MITKKNRITFVLIICLLTLISMLVINTANAQEIDEESGESVTTQEQEAPTNNEPTLTEIFYEKYLPIIISVASGAGAFLIALFPLIKTIAGRDAARGLYTATKNELERCKEQLKEIADIDYKAVIGQTVGELTANLKAEIETKFNNLDGFLSQSLQEKQLLSEKLDKLTAAASVVWSAADGVPEILASIPTATVLKKSLLLNEKLKETIAQFKGDEADAIISAVESKVQEAT